MSNENSQRFADFEIADSLAHQRARIARIIIAILTALSASFAGGFSIYLMSEDAPSSLAISNLERDEKILQAIANNEANIGALADTLADVRDILDISKDIVEETKTIKRLIDVENGLSSLTEALLLEDPKKAVSLLRLGDAVEHLEANLDDLERANDSKQRATELSLQREIDSLWNVIFLLFLPLAGLIILSVIPLLRGRPQHTSDS